MKALAHTTS
jgi:hypothetical protein